ncbi:precorrin-2 dehydrogenase/sirohydrochlorin ferrochelatase family protein [Photobacterium angustum]|uniref:precorrin-2 dehydrogenase/sirohydrochlorin ferrochelatase family protein n=1 Tax=Photobacterium angustum TaxID=661 RepID=UPI0005E7EBA4|nr:siroheme synthase [Photobacterium angustum]KJG17751.1 ferrochelatase [Photobacterium angustum]KJG24958.1 ferrochelatase [Photobacterium angustum]KJG32913.1 ferrochelatase [Photobacterium angustum]PSW97531.1 siroheme synthase [Photobacterium angustum]PSX00636.1 siroheme synthase [Photobacterium angustum]
MDFFPVFLKLTHKKVLVVGGGEVACRKVDLLLKAQANITLVSPELHPHLVSLLDEGKFEYLKARYEKSLLTQFDQVWATTDSRELNHQVYHDANALKIWTNVVDDPAYCDFITPSMIDRSPMQVAISSGGASPVLVRYLRERFETQLPQNLSLLADYSGQQRTRIKQHYKTVDERRKFWETFFRLPAVETATTEQELEQAFSGLLTSYQDTGANLYLIETGNDPELLTLKALRLMQQSEFVLYPDGKNDIFVDLCRRDAERESYEHENVITRAKQLLDEGMRVCILASKDKHRPALKKLCVDRNGIFVPSHS